MQARFDLRTAAPQGYAAMLTLAAHVRECGLDHVLLELIKIRVSQLNGCAFCIDMHVTAARRLGLDGMCAHFTPAQIAELSLAVAEINAWNRLMIAARTPPRSTVGRGA